MKVHHERRVLPYAPEQVFAVVMAIERYPEFLPWCMAVRMRERKANELTAELVIGFKMIRERFTSRVLFDRPHRIDVDYLEGPMRHLENHWIFHPHAQGCEVEFRVAFEFRSRMLEALIGALFTEAVHRMVAAFETRARQLYGAGAAAPDSLRPV
jgi:coenzyme Q-binding protein COQ10